MFTRPRGIVLPMVIAFTAILTIVGFALLTLAEQEIIQTRIEADKNKAFYYAEAGIARLSEKLEKPVVGGLPESFNETVGQGDYRVVVDENDGACYAISTGVSGVVQKKIRVRLSFLAAPFENAVFAMNKGGGNWAFQLRGTGNPVAAPGRERGGRDVVNGNIFVDGDAYLYERSAVNPAPAPNSYELYGDVGATGSVSLFNDATVSGAINQHSEPPPPVDILAMDYEHHNTHNVSMIFQSAGIGSGYLPAGNQLRNIFVKNPADRAAECSATSGDDYFLEPSSITGGAGSEKDAKTPLDLGADRVYYVDGDVWIHNKITYGFNVTGRVTIVATGNIHICDNTKYANTNSLLGLVALGKYDNSGNLTSGGNIFFGDPRYGTMFQVAGLMFAANDFLFNTDVISRQTAEPTSGFVVNGSFAAMNKVSVERDWYTKGSEARPASYDHASGQWMDSVTRTALSSAEAGTLRHYQMVVNYDDRVRSPETQPPGLPRGMGSIFTGFSHWEEL
ncbi:MAG: pilus assembly PilX N-terminal domain-containing protein [Sedimentisphaerales bacterium]|nr:pilus assembly PilX N-terminal domain-containing protein [Sedimentisphaerales bacterium]